MIAVAAWVVAGIALWLSRSVLDVFDAAGHTTRVAMFPSGPELAGLVMLLLIGAAAAAALVKTWIRDAADRKRAFLQISLPLFGLLLIVLPYLPWLPDIIEPLRALAGPIVKVIWLIVGGQALLAFFSVRAMVRGRPARHPMGAPLILLATVAASSIPAIHFRDTLTAVALIHFPEASPGIYPNAVWPFVAISALTAVMTWRWIVTFTGSKASATFAWACVFLSAPVLFASVSIGPEIPAAFCVVIAVAWRSNPQQTETPWGEYLIRGLAVSALPWLSIAYAPMAAALIVLLGVRALQNSRAVLALLVPFTVSLVRWVRVYHPQPFGSPIAGALGLLFDQEFGVLLYGPALAVGLIGLWQMAKIGRRDLALLFAVVLVGAGAFANWWGAQAPPGGPLVPALPLLGLPIALVYMKAPDGSVSKAALQLLMLAGLAFSVSMIFASDGSLVVQDRDGSARLLQWLTMLWPIWQVMPSIAAAGLRASAGLIAIWIVTASLVAWIARRNGLRQPGASALMATFNVTAAILIVAVVGPAVAHTEPDLVMQPEARSRLATLDDFDSLARPHAVIYQPFRIARAADIPPLMSLAAAPGLRTGGQPMRVFLNARYALAAGEYEVEIGGLHASDPVRGTVALQVGRNGSPLREWPVELVPGATWKATFDVPVDAEFVGFRTSDEISKATSLRVVPLKIVDKNNRESSFHGRPRAVLAAVGFPSASVLFHDEDVYPETDGFWIKGESTAYMTVATTHPEDGVTLHVHSGATPNTVTFATTTWGQRVDLTAGTETTVRIPSPPRPGPFLLRVSADKGFVPADVVPGTSDRRMLGCWIEIAPE